MKIGGRDEGRTADHDAAVATSACSGECESGAGEAAGRAVMGSASIIKARARGGHSHNATWVQRWRLCLRAKWERRERMAPTCGPRHQWGDKEGRVRQRRLLARVGLAQEEKGEKGKEGKVGERAGRGEMGQQDE